MKDPPQRMEMRLKIKTSNTTAYEKQSEFNDLLKESLGLESQDGVIKSDFELINL